MNGGIKARCARQLQNSNCICGLAICACPFLCLLAYLIGLILDTLLNGKLCTAWQSEWTDNCVIFDLCTGLLIECVLSCGLALWYLCRYQRQLDGMSNTLVAV